MSGDIKRRVDKLEESTWARPLVGPPKGRPTTLDQIRALKEHIRHIEVGMGEEELRAERADLEELFALVQKHPLDEEIEAIADEIARIEQLDAKGG